MASSSSQHQAHAAPASVAEANSKYFTVEGSDRRYNRNVLLVVLLVPLMMSLLQVSAVNTMMTPMAASIGATPTAQQWILSGFALAIGIVLIPAGRMGDIFGRSAVFVIGLAVFTIASLLIGVASSPLWVNIFRILQGIGGGIYAPQITGIITQYFQGKQRAMAFAMMGLVVSVAVAAGPLISGFSIQWFGDALGWRIAFLINVPLGIIGLILATQILPFGKERRHFKMRRKKAAGDSSSTSEVASGDGAMAAATTREDRSREATARKATADEATAQRERIDLDPVGMVLITLCVLGIMLPFMLHEAWAWWFLPAAAVLLVAWVVWEQWYKRRRHAPMVDLALFRIPSFSFATLVGLFQFLGLPPIFAALAIYLQSGFGVPALEVAFVTLPNAIVSALAAVWAGKLVYRHSAGIQVLGMGLNLVGVLGTILVVFGINHGDLNYWWISAPITIMGLGSGALGAANNTLSMQDMPPANAGTAGGIYQTAQRIATAIGIAIITAVLFATVGGSTEISDWHAGFTAGLTVSAVIIVIALGLAFVYWRLNYRRRLAQALAASRAE